MIAGSGRSTGEGIGYPLQYSWASLVVQLVKNPPAMLETWVRPLGWENPLEEGMTTHPSILAWRILCSWGLEESDMTKHSTGAGMGLKVTELLPLPASSPHPPSPPFPSHLFLPLFLLPSLRCTLSLSLCLSHTHILDSDDQASLAHILNMTLCVRGGCTYTELN